MNDTYLHITLTVVLVEQQTEIIFQLLFIKLNWTKMESGRMNMNQRKIMSKVFIRFAFDFHKN